MKKYLIKEYRQEFNYTQAQLAELVGMRPTNDCKVGKY